MKKDILKNTILDFHVEPLAELFDRDIEVPLSSGKIISLIGVRRSGKTSFLLKAIGKLIKQGIDIILTGKTSPSQYFMHFFHDFLLSGVHLYGVEF